MQLDLNAARLGGDVLGVALGETPEAQQTRIFGQINEFFAIKSNQLIAFERDTERIYTNARLSKKGKLQEPLVLAAGRLIIRTEDKTFAWGSYDGFITISIFENILSVQQNGEDGDETLTQFMRW